MNDDENISKIYQRGKQGKPPAHLDDSILNAARDAVDVSGGKTGNETQINDAVKIKNIAKSPFSGGWPATASIAAVLIITVILVPLINQESEVSSSAPVVTSEEEPSAKSAGISNRVDDGAVEMKKRLTVQQQDLRSVQSPARLPKAVTPSMHSDAFNTRSSETLSNMNGAAETGGSIKSGGFMREESAMLGASMGEKSLAPQKSRESTNRKAMLYKAKSARKKEQLEGEIFESEAVARDFVQSDSMQPEARQQVSKGYGAKAGVMQPKKWLEKISLLLDVSDFEQAETEVEEFRRCYPDEVIGESLLNRLSARQ